MTFPARLPDYLECWCDLLLGRDLMVVVDAVASVNCFSVMSTAVNRAPKLDSPKRRHSNSLAIISLPQYAASCKARYPEEFLASTSAPLSTRVLAIS